MKKFLLLFSVLLISCSNSLNSVNNEWIRYKKLSWKVAESYIGTQFDYENLSFRIELPAYYVSDGMMNNYKIKVIAYEKEYVNYDNLSSKDETSNLEWNGKSYFSSNKVFNPMEVEDSLLKSISNLKSRISSIKLIINNLNGDNQAWEYETLIREPVYPENGLSFGVVDDYLITEIFNSQEIDNANIMLVLTIDGEDHSLNISPMSSEILDNFKSYINEENIKLSRNAELHNL